MLDVMYSSGIITYELLNGVIWEILLDNDRPCGYISYSCGEDDSVRLSKIYLEKNSRGKGIAGVAIDRVVSYAARNGRKYVSLNVNKKNARAISAYQKNGFTITDSVVKDIGHGFVMDDYIMKRPVESRPRSR